MAMEHEVYTKLFNYLIFEILPCLKVKEIPEFLSINEYCAMWSISIANYLKYNFFSFIYVFIQIIFKVKD